MARINANPISSEVDLNKRVDEIFDRSDVYRRGALVNKADRGSLEQFLADWEQGKFCVVPRNNAPIFPPSTGRQPLPPPSPSISPGPVTTRPVVTTGQQPALPSLSPLPTSPITSAGPSTPVTPTTTGSTPRPAAFTSPATSPTVPRRYIAPRLPESKMELPSGTVIARPGVPAPISPPIVKQPIPTTLPPRINITTPSDSKYPALPTTTARPVPTVSTSPIVSSQPVGASSKLSPIVPVLGAAVAAPALTGVLRPQPPNPVPSTAIRVPAPVVSEAKVVTANVIEAQGGDARQLTEQQTLYSREGSKAKLFSAKYKGNTVIVRQIPNGTLSKDELVSEIAVVTELGNTCHDCFFCYVDHFTDEKNTYIVNTYPGNYTVLEQFLTNIDCGIIEYRYEMVVNLIRCVDAMHDLNIAHRTLGTDNIMFSRFDNKIRIINFDTACIEQKCANVIMRPEDYTDTTAPEVITGQISSFAKMDIWSMGVIIFLILSNTDPWINYSKIRNEAVKLLTEISQPPLRIDNSILDDLEKLMNTIITRRYYDVTRRDGVLSLRNMLQVNPALRKITR